MSEIYHGVSLPDAYRAIAHDLGGMREYVMRCPEPVGVITVVRNDRRS